MIYRIVSNGKEFKIQRKGRGLVRGSKIFFSGFNYVIKTSKDWEDLKYCDIDKKYSDIVFGNSRGNCDHWEDDYEKGISTRIFKDKFVAESAMYYLMRELIYQENKHNWKEVSISEEEEAPPIGAVPKEQYEKRVHIKPPKGIISRRMCEENRIEELAQAISRYVNHGYTEAKKDLIIEWAKELIERVENFPKRDGVK